MKHLFSSGEILSHQNEKALDEGIFIGETLEYEGVAEDTSYICHGTIDGKPMQIHFILEEDSFETVAFKKRLGILMQTDVFEGHWAQYSVVAGA